MRNTKMEKLAGLVGEWAVTISDAWFLEPPGTVVPGAATVEWLGKAFLYIRSEFHGAHDGGREMSFVLGRHDPNDVYTALYHDERGTCRVYAMTFDGGRWTMTREDHDMHQRFIAEVDKDRILGRWEASADGGTTWRKDFDLTFERA